MDCKLPIGFAGEIVATVVYTSLAIGGSLGNILIILVIYRATNLQTVCGVLIANVAVADLMVTSIVMPTLVFTLVQGFLEQCFYNKAISVAFLTALFSATASLLTLTLLSVDRCFAICKPMKHKTMVTMKKVKFILTKTWIESFTLPILVAFYGESAPAKYIQTLGVVGCYSMIVVSGFLTIRHVRANSVMIGTLHSDQGTSRITADLSQRNKQVAKTIAIVVILFTLCWIPIAFVISVPNPDTEGRIYFWFATLGLANSSVNPWIYFYRQSNYRNALKRLFGAKNKIVVQPK
ncbi:nociceptin receptor-like [Oculina patagonica]